MNYSKRMKVNFKRLIITWIITLIIVAIASVLIFTEVNQAEAEPVVFLTPTVQETEQIVSLGEYQITAYCSCEKCCGAWALNRKTVVGAAGVELQEGVSVASALPFGTEILIDGIGEYVVQDRTADWIGDDVIDIYFEKHQEALNFGKQKREVFIND
jgi:3D (Asp-Asp-Asp) domain-containing protein